MRLVHGDCIEKLGEIQDGSIDLVLTDPPYNIGKADWDKISNYINWCAEWLSECKRVLKPNGVLYFWHNNPPLIAQLMERIRTDKLFVYNSFCVWDKGEAYRAQTWKQRDEKSAGALRSWFNSCEYLLEYLNVDTRETGLNNRMLVTGALFPIVDYLIAEKKAAGLTHRQVCDILQQSHPHTFNRGPGWRMPSRSMYAALQKATGRFSKSYDKLLAEYNQLKDQHATDRYYHVCDTNHRNVFRRDALRYEQKTSGHPCEKPVDILRRLVRVSCPPGGTVLDPFMGGGSCGVAAIAEGRDFVGIELDDKWFSVASALIGQTKIIV